MSEEKFKGRYRIPSTRAAWHDYLGGTYFVTICTKDREFFLGKIEDEQMHLSEIGKYAEEQFRDVFFVLSLCGNTFLCGNAQPYPCHCHHQ